MTTQPLTAPPLTIPSFILSKDNLQLIFTEPGSTSNFDRALAAGESTNNAITIMIAKMKFDLLDFIEKPFQQKQ
jgi:hypothetical protein